MNRNRSVLIIFAVAAMVVCGSSLAFAITLHQNTYVSINGCDGTTCGNHVLAEYGSLGVVLAGVGAVAPMLWSTTTASMVYDAPNPPPGSAIAYNYLGQANQCDQSLFPCLTVANALSWTASGGKVTVIGGGLPALTGTLTITSPVTIDGSSVGTLIAGTGNDGIDITAPNGSVYLKNLQITGNGGNTGITHTGAGNLFVQNCNINQFSLNGISFSGTGSLYVQDSKLSELSNNGISYTGTGNLHVEDSKLSDCAYNGISFSGAGKLYVQNSELSEFSQNGISYTGTGNLNVENSKLSDCAYNGISYTGAGSAWVQSSKLSDCGYNGVNFTVTGSLLVQDCDISYIALSGIRFTGVGGLSVDGSKITGFTNDGIYFGPTGISGLNVANTTILNTGSGVGVYLDNTYSSVRLPAAIQKSQIGACTYGVEVLGNYWASVSYSNITENRLVGVYTNYASAVAYLDHDSIFFNDPGINRGPLGGNIVNVIDNGIVDWGGSPPY